MANRTPYAETEFLLVVMEKNQDEIARLKDAMSPGEKRALRQHLRDADDALDD